MQNLKFDEGNHFKPNLHDHAMGNQILIYFTEIFEAKRNTNWTKVFNKVVTESKFRTKYNKFSIFYPNSNFLFHTILTNILILSDDSSIIK